MSDGRIHNGGSRQGAGRKKGVRNKRTQALIIQAETGGVMPLDVMLHAMRKALEEGDLDAAHGRACDAAPYLHSKLKAVATVTNPLDLRKLTDEQLQLALCFLESLEGT